MTSRQLCAFFYVDLGEGLFECKKCGRSRKQASGTGNSNHLGHLAPEATAATFFHPLRKIPDLKWWREFAECAVQVVMNEAI
ncbi:hypothetical protein GQ600_9411 [Phytophthora cactorum]|nr:hypothetical protein GQ600_9411 [Phytophthora cactorum]